MSVKTFGGIREVDPSFDNVLQEVHGCMDRPTGILKKFQGKILNTTGVSAAIWSISQLKFSDRITNVRRVGSTMQAYPDYRRLPPYIPLKKHTTTDVSVIPTPSLRAPWQPPEWPQSYPLPTWPNPVRSPQYTQATIPLYYFRLTCTPSAFAFNASTGPTSGTTVLEALSNNYVTDSDIKVSWDSHVNWLATSCGGNGNVFNTLWDDGTMSTHQQNITISVIPGAVPPGTTTVTITFTLVACSSFDDVFQPVVDGSGAIIKATCVVTVTKDPPLFTGTMKITTTRVDSTGISFGPRVDLAYLVNTTGSNATGTLDGLDFHVRKLAVQEQGVAAGTWVVDYEGVPYWQYTPGYGSTTSLEAITGWTMDGCPCGVIIRTRGNGWPVKHPKFVSQTFTAYYEKAP
jgi:hypothetical protein